MNRTDSARRGRMWALGCASLGASAAAFAGLRGAPPDYEFQWATIGAPGNRATLPQETPGEPSRAVGAVGSIYRIATTEVTIGQWYEFVQAYAPYIGAEYYKGEFRGNGVEFVGFGAGGVPRYVSNPANADVPTTAGWRFAARFCNWLVNNKGSSFDAFQTGAYDTSTFTVNPDGTVNDQANHTPGASFWIPSTDEWVKAVYYDPNRYGAGQEGYWRHPNASATPLVGGFPGEPGAQTAAPLTYGPGYPIPVGAYPDVNLPWGLLDVSGGEQEWTEGFEWAASDRRAREVRGSRTGSGEFFWVYDRIDTATTDGPASGEKGFRIASTIPSPAWGSVLLIASVVAPRRRPSV